MATPAGAAPARRAPGTPRATCSTAPASPETTTDGRAVHRRHRHPGHAVQRRGHLGLGRRDRGHRPAARQRLHQPRPRRHQAARVLQRQHPGRVRRGDLPDRVPGHRVRGDPGRGQQRHQARLHREQPRLREHRLVGPLVIVTAPSDHLGHRHPQLGLQQPARLGRTPPRTPATPRAAPAPSPPAATPCPANTNPTRARPPDGTTPATTPARGLPRRHRRQPGRQLLPPRADHHRPVLERRPRRGQRPGHVRRVQLRPRRQRTPPAGPPAPPAPPPTGPTPAHGTGPPASTGGGAWLAGRRRPRSSAAGASSRMTCALVPLIPKADTPARRGRPLGGQGTGSVSSRTVSGRPVHVRGRLVGVQRARAAGRAAAPAPS